MKQILLILILLCFPLLVKAQDTKDNTVSAEDKQPQQASPVEESVPPSVPWPKPFKPSEKIGADSQISFPTDI